MKRSRRVHVWLFFAAVYLVSWSLWTPVLLSGEGLSRPINKALIGIGAFVPSIMGILFTYLTGDREARRDFWKRASRWPRGHTRMAITALLVLPILEIISFILPSLLEGAVPSLSYASEMLLSWVMVTEFLFVELIFGALSEELGWRGYALDELQSKWSALTASLVLGLIWALWHTPAFLIPGLSQYEMGGVFSWAYVAFIVSVTAGSVLHTWAYNNTGRSILVAGILMHFVRNATTIFMGGIFDRFAVPEGYWVALPIVYILAAVVVVGIWGPKTLASSAGKRWEVSERASPAS